MRLGRAALAVLPILLGAALLAAWLVPPQLDWAQYRTTIAQLASARLGLPVTIEGPVTLTLLPEPGLTAGQVSVGDPAADGLLIRVEALRLRLALWPLLTGRIDARELVLHGPDLHIPWPAQPGMLSAHPPAWLAAFSARVEDGRLSVGQFAVTGIDGSLSSLDTGALQAAATADIAGQRWRVAVRLTSAGLDGTSGLNVTLDGQGRAEGTYASFTGQFSAQGQLAGTIKAAGPNLSVLLPAPALRFSAAGRLTVADGLAEADELTVQLNGAPAAGAVALRMLPHPRLDLALSAARLDLDAWAPLLLSQPAERRPMPIGLDFSADAATLGGAALQHLRATFELVPNAVLVREAAASLPGDATLLLSGRIGRTDAAGPRFEGTGRLRAPVLRATLQFLLPRAAGVLAELPPGVAQAAELDGDVLVQPNRILLTRLRGTLDGNPLTGSLGWKAGAPPAVAADLRFDRLRLDPFLAAGATNATLQRVVLQRIDTDLRLHVQQASIGGTPVSDLTLDAATRAGDVDLRRLEASALNAHLVAKGVFAQGGRVSGASLRLISTDATPLRDLLPAAWRGTPALWFGSAELVVTAAGPSQAVAGSVSLTLGNLHLDLQPIVNLAAGTARSSLTLRASNAMRLIANLGLPVRLGLDGTPVWLGEGSFSLVAQAALGPGRRISLEDGELVAGRLRTRLHLMLDAGQDEPALAGSIAAETLPLPMPGNATLPVDLLRGWQAKLQVKAGHVLANDASVLSDAGATLRLGNGRLRLDQVTARLGGGALSGSASLDAAQAPPALALQVTLADAGIDAPVPGLPIGVASGQASGSASLTASGYSTAAILASLSGSAAATVRDGTLSGFDLGQLRDLLRPPSGDLDDAGLRKALAGGETHFQTLALRGTIAHGILSIDQAALTGEAGTAQASGSVALPDAAADLHIVLHPALPDAPAIGVQLNGRLAAPHRTPELAAVARWRAGQAP